ncbi:MAG TPA: methylmalonyl Co-A mutase-associated GTPase MeaB [Acidimicrobiia bacterium]|nr:methylmalonyl Co-A mutase-associated GTPase MeaB [Acidimicrobiia bacterium]
MTELAARLRDGDRRALARAITLVESTRADHRREADGLLTEVLPASGHACRVGISGSPGSGKSTLIESLGLHVIDQGHAVAVLAVDPSSTRSGGSILGDKTRMGELTQRGEAFVRPSPTGGTLGGVARRTREAMLLCEAAGFDVVLIETVGTGQSEVAVEGMVDGFVVLVGPGAGDELQGIKRGIVELADLVAVTKADGELAHAAEVTAAEYASALRLLRPKHPEWTPTVVRCSALTGAGIAELWAAIEALRDTLTTTGALARRRAEQARAWLWTEIGAGLLDRVRGEPSVAELAHRLEADAVAGRIPPPVAAEQVLAAFLGRSEPLPN